MWLSLSVSGDRMEGHRPYRASEALGPDLHLATKEGRRVDGQLAGCSCEWVICAICSPPVIATAVFSGRRTKGEEMSITITKKLKLKQALGAKTKSRKKELEHETSLCAMSASADGSLLPDLKMERHKISELKGLKRRARKTEKGQLELVARSLTLHKQCVPVLISPDGEIINGHIVVEALQKLGEKHVWCVVVDHLDEHQRELLHVTLNRIQECGEWDLEALGSLLFDLGDLGFDLQTTGFTLPELDIIMTPPLGDDEASPGDVDDELLPPTCPVTLAGDLWQLDVHRVLCGDATDPESYKVVLGTGVADLIFADCPWNVPIEGFVSGLGKVKHKDFKMGVGEMSPDEFADFCNTFHALGSKHLKPGGVFFSCIDWRSHDVVVAGGKAAGLRHINTAVWNKGSGGMGAPYRSAHEFVVVFNKGTKVAVNNVELGKHGRDRTNVWTYPGANRRGSSASKALAHHPTPKPIELVEDAIRDVTEPKALVLDMFLGSGTSVLAAERSGRVARGIELDPAYVDVAIRRWQELTGMAAIHVATGMTFAELETERVPADLDEAA